MGGGIGMGNTCKPMAVLFQCMTKFTTNKTIKLLKKNKKKNKKIKHPVSMLEKETVIFFWPSNLSQKCNYRLVLRGHR